jgi:endonuclease/exonuclease/phosphatase family metal-dependent hydrolase
MILKWLSVGAQRLRWLVAPAISVILVAGVVGQLVRDRNSALAVLMYLPIVPVGAMAVVVDLGRSGRALSRGRFLLTILGFSSIGVGVFATPMVGIGAIQKGSGGNWSVKVLQWNVQWGGGLFRTPETWREQRAEIVRYDADLVILSEPPEATWFDLLLKDSGPKASYVKSESGPGSPHWFRMAVVSQWPLQLEQTIDFPGGHGMSVAADLQGKTFRMLVVDGVSDPFRSRLPFLGAVADLLEHERSAGRPYDLIAGDFNTPARSVGFDNWSLIGYQLASRLARGWRGTFPSWLPLYDIDHVWVRPGRLVWSCEIVPGVRSDHRVQVVEMKQGTIPDP